MGECSMTEEANLNGGIDHPAGSVGSSLLISSAFPVQ